MRCSCCNVALSDYESSLRSVSTGAYLDTCLSCLKKLSQEGVEIKYEGNPLLFEDDNTTDDFCQEENEEWHDA